jgi:putative phosphoribosyl transferase
MAGGVAGRGRDVLLIDDGLATGATVRAALGELPAGAPRWLVFASPVRAAELAAALCADGGLDEVVRVVARARFGGQLARLSPQTGDEKVLAVLRGRPGA